MKTIFSKIINREIAAEIIYEDDRIIAIKDKYPIRKGHFLVIPKKHAINLRDISDDELSYLMLKSRELAVLETNKLGIAGFKLMINNGRDADQEIMHIHVHIIPAIKKPKS